MNEITIEIGRVHKNFNLQIRGTDHVELKTWDHESNSPHYAEVIFYSINPEQVLEQFIEALKLYLCKRVLS